MIKPNWRIMWESILDDSNGAFLENKYKSMKIPKRIFQIKKIFLKHLNILTYDTKVF